MEDSPQDRGPIEALNKLVGRRAIDMLAPPWALELIRGYTALVARHDGHELVCTERHSHNAEKFDNVARSLEEYVDQRAARDVQLDDKFKSIEVTFSTGLAAGVNDRAAMRLEIADGFKEIRSVLWRAVFIVLGGMTTLGVGVLLALFRHKLGFT